MPADETSREGEARERTRRLFFALWPDEVMRAEMAQAIHKAAGASGGRPVPVDNLHVTLAFLGSVPERRLPDLAAVARTAAGTPSPGLRGADAAESRIELILNHLEHWPVAQLLCASPTEPPAALAALAQTLQNLLLASGFSPDLKPFRPHVTVVRKVMRPGRMGRMHPVVWRFRELALVESRTLAEGAVYSVVESFPLCSWKKAANNSESP